MDILDKDPFDLHLTIKVKSATQVCVVYNHPVFKTMKFVVCVYLGNYLRPKLDGELSFSSLLRMVLVRWALECRFCLIV